ncbi:MAG TPA: hypothetical protein VI653_05050, partial [Steroidobacteraceae bacterium]
MRDFVAVVLLFAVFAAAPAWAAGPGKPTSGTSARQDLEIVECLLPGQVRHLGNSTYVSARRPTRTTTADCRVRGGEYVSYDKADYKTALKIWMAAAETGDPEAQTNVGTIYERGLGGTPDFEAAAIWYQKAADQGYGRALFNLGTLYELGEGVEKDRLKALNLYRKAWGLPEDNIMFTSTAQRESQQQRAQLQKVIAEKDEQLQLLREQLEQSQKAAEHIATLPGSDAGAAKKIEALQHLIAKLESERRDSSGELAALPTAPTREPQSNAPPAPPLDPQAQSRLVRGMDFGRYYALIIGNQNYRVLEQLATPLADAEHAARILQDK